VASLFLEPENRPARHSQPLAELRPNGMPYSNEQLAALQKALATGEKRVTFGDKTVEYRSIEELREAIREVERDLFEQTDARAPRQIRVTTAKGT
jgi:hypothetical protein